MHDCLNAKQVEIRIVNLTKLLCVIFTAALFIPSVASGEEIHVRNGFWGGIDAGAGYLKQSFEERNEDDAYFFMGFKGGYTINPHFLLGVELSGWLLEAGDPSDPNKGKGLMQALVITRLYPFKDSGLFAKAGGGYVSNWSNRSDEPNRKNGWGFTLGGGYDITLDGFLPDLDIALSPFATFSYGNTGNWDYRAVTVGIGFTFH
jgi:hypothetical protein